jgi:GNAT superfamily N-acetyltransferase
MSFAMRHRDDPMPVLPSTHSLSVRREESAEIMATLQERSAGELWRRFDDGHRAYVASMDGELTAWGWVATRTASIGELGATFSMPESDRYLWNFVTRPSYRGLGIYPRLLEAIVRAESAEAERFWIAYAPENHASGNGIAKAGFHAVAEMSFTPMAVRRFARSRPVGRGRRPGCSASPRPPMSSPRAGGASAPADPG